MTMIGMVSNYRSNVKGTVLELLVENVESLSAIIMVSIRQFAGDTCPYLRSLCTSSYGLNGIVVRTVMEGQSTQELS
jgi:hypothetical protein